MTITNFAAWSIELWTNGGYFDSRKKSLETGSEADRTHCLQVCVGLPLNVLLIKLFIFFAPLLLKDNLNYFFFINPLKALVLLDLRHQSQNYMKA